MAYRYTPRDDHHRCHCHILLIFFSTGLTMKDADFPGTDSLAAAKMAALSGGITDPVVPLIPQWIPPGPEIDHPVLPPGSDRGDPGWWDLRLLDRPEKNKKRMRVCFRCLRNCWKISPGKNRLSAVNTYLKLTAGIGAIVLCLLSGSFIARSLLRLSFPLLSCFLPALTRPLMGNCLFSSSGLGS